MRSSLGPCSWSWPFAYAIFTGSRPGESVRKSANGNVLLFVVARSRLNLYVELRRHFEDWRDVRIVLDRREGERRTPHGMFARADRRRVERRHRYPDLRKLGWSVVDTDEPNS